VVEGADQAEVQLRDGRKFIGRDIKYDAKTDLALIRLDTKEALPFLELGDSDKMEIGDRVLAVGAPFGLTGSVTAGIISAKGRSLKVNMYEDFLQTDAAINPGNSGGPLVSLEGKVIGVNSAIKSRSGGFQGVGLAIASNLVRHVTDQLLKSGVVQRGYLGVQIKDFDNPAVAARLGVKEGHGVLVTQVFPKGPASKAGLQDGDVILSLDGKTIKDGRELQLVVASLPLGKPVAVNLVRDGKPLSLEVTVEEQPQTFGTSRVPVPRMPRDELDTISLDKVGLEVADLTPGLANGLGYKEDLRGALVVNTSRLGPAAQAGLVRGMVITKVDRKGVDSAKGLREALAGVQLATGVLLQVQTPQGGTNFVLLKSGTE
jgi:serine protease Do